MSPDKTDRGTATSAILQMLIDSIPIPIFYQDMDGVCVGCNQKFGEFIGREREEIIGKAMSDVVAPNLAAIYAKMSKDLPQTGAVQTYEKPVLHPDGTVHYIIFNRATLNKSDGTPSGIISTMLDITQRKELEAELQKNEAKYRRIFENIQDVYYEIELDGTILEISPSIEKYSPFKRKDLIGRSIYDFYISKERRNELLQAIGKQGFVRDFEIQLHDKQSGRWNCSITAALMPGDEKRRPWIVGSLRDISERKRNEEILRQREEELTIKSRNLEEVNTALKVLLKQREKDRSEIEENVLANVKSSIIPYLGKLKEGPLTKQQRTCLGMLEGHLQEIISPFLRSLTRNFFELTAQEMRVADLVKNGHTTKEIAEILGISMKTVDYHRDNIRKKLGVKNHHASLRSFLLKFS